MALATTLSTSGTSGSGLGRRLKALPGMTALLCVSLMLAACQTGSGVSGGPGGGRGEGTNLEAAETGPDGIRRGPRPNVSPIGNQGPQAYGPPRSGSGIGAGPVKIALLIPQSGRSADQVALGNALFDAAQMALFDTGRSDISLIVKNTGGGGGTAANAAEQAINEGAEIILGPVFADEVGSVRSVAASRGVPVIAFSSDSSTAGGGAYLLSFTVEEEIRTVVNYAASRGMGLFATLTPQTAYGRRAKPAFDRDVAAIGGQVVAGATYPPAKNAMYPSIMQLSGKDFDAIFIPDGGSNLRDVAGLVRFGPPPPPPSPAPKPLTPEEIAAGKVQPPPPPPPPPPVRAQLPDHVLLGTGLWDEPTNGRSGGLARGVFAAPEPSTRERFAARFESNYNYRPPRVASLGYDAVSLAATLSGSPAGQRFTASEITNPNGFMGVDGIFRFLPNGTIQRGLAIIEVTGSGFGVIRPAPRSFQSLGY